MDRTRELLSLPPWEALVSMINAEYGFSLDYQTTHLYALEPLDDNQMELTIQVRRSKAWHNLLPQVDQYTFQYRRLDLGTFFNADGKALVLDDSRQFTTTVDLMEEISTRTGVYFDIDDVYHEPLPNGRVIEYTIRAHPRSLRWVGELTVTLGKPLTLSATQTTLLGPVAGTGAGLSTRETLEEFIDFVYANNQYYYTDRRGVYGYDLASETWSLVTDVNVGVMYWMGVYHNDLLMGRDSSGLFYRINTNTKYLSSFPSPDNRRDGAVEVIGDHLYLYGGRGDSHLHTDLKFDRYHLGTNTWETVPLPPDDTPWPREELRSCVHEGALVVMGVEDRGYRPPYQVGMYHPDTGVWEHLGDLELYSGGSWCRLVSYQGQLLLLYPGGHGDYSSVRNRRYRALLYDVDVKTWTQVDVDPVHVDNYGAGVLFIKDDALVAVQNNQTATDSFVIDTLRLV